MPAVVVSETGNNQREGTNKFGDQFLCGVVHRESSPGGRITTSGSNDLWPLRDITPDSNACILAGTRRGTPAFLRISNVGRQAPSIQRGKANFFQEFCEARICLPKRVQI